MRFTLIVRAPPHPGAGADSKQISGHKRAAAGGGVGTRGVAESAVEVEIVEAAGPSAPKPVIL
jgi:hypothetical protein